jgi:hypothetical protein
VYPLQVGGTSGVAGQQCVSNDAYVYCIGGQDANGGPRSEVYSSSPISSSSSNITSWVLNANRYPQNIDGQSCTVYSGYVYCVGGTYNDNGDDVPSSYYAKLGDTGQVGNWSSTTAYPVPIDSQSCATSSSYILCVGGDNETDGSSADAVWSDSVWYAQLSTAGIGSWSPTAAYPGGTYFPSCISADGYIYCFGGIDTNGNSVNAAYYAPVSSDGVGAWTATTNYPVQVSGQACAVSSGYVYCVGGVTGGGQNPTFANGAYYAPVSQTGVGAWSKAQNFPQSAWTDCVTSSGELYCIGGFDGSSLGENNIVNYASLTSLSSTTTQG